VIQMLFRKFRNDQTAATTTEYALMLALIAMIGITTISMVGGESGGFWSGSAETLEQTLTR
jgi:Flp pilus assembly pilin Flp